MSEVYILDNVVHVLLNNSKNEFICNLCDIDTAINYQWCEMQYGYACTHLPNDKVVLFHRIILGEPKGKEVDHINRNVRDNRRCNLRAVNHSDNMFNRKKQTNNKSGITGVNWKARDKIWCASISKNGKRIHLGCSKNFDEAVNIRKNAESELFGYLEV